MSEDEDFDLEKVLKEISKAWKETKDHFGIKGDLDAKIKIKGWKDMNIKIQEEDQDE